MEISRVLPLESENIQTREQWLRWLLKNRLVVSPEMCEPFGRQVLAQAAQGGQTICLSMDQTEVGNRFAILMVSVGVGDRALLLVWQVEAGTLRDRSRCWKRVHSWLPRGVGYVVGGSVLSLLELFEWLSQAQWQYRLRLKGNLTVDVGCADVTTTAELAADLLERQPNRCRMNRTCHLTGGTMRFCSMSFRLSRFWGCLIVSPVAY